MSDKQNGEKADATEKLTKNAETAVDVAAAAGSGLLNCFPKTTHLGIILGATTPVISITTPSLAFALACPARCSDLGASAAAEDVRGKQA